MSIFSVTLLCSAVKRGTGEGGSEAASVDDAEDGEAAVAAVEAAGDERVGRDASPADCNVKP